MASKKNGASYSFYHATIDKRSSQVFPGNCVLENIIIQICTDSPFSKTLTLESNNDSYLVPHNNIPRASYLHVKLDISLPNWTCEEACVGNTRLDVLLSFTRMRLKGFPLDENDILTKLDELNELALCCQLVDSNASLCNARHLIEPVLQHKK